MAGLTRAATRLIPERLERPLRSSSFRRMALGAVAGGLTLALGGAAAGLSANLVSYGIALVLFSRIRVADEQSNRQTTGKRGGLIDGLRYVLRHRALTVVVGGFALGTLAT